MSQQALNMKPVYTFHEGPGHGWLEVSTADLYRYGIDTKRLSRYSYFDRDAQCVYLEEDADLGEFVRQMKAKGVEVSLQVRHTNERHIRSLPRLPNLNK